MNNLDVGKNPSVEMDPAELELSIRGRNLSWLDNNQIETWPGPIAFEYVRLKDIINEGNIEGSCWKIINLVESIVSYFFAAAIEDGYKPPKNRMLTIGFKIGKIQRYFNGEHFDSLILSLKSVNEWRNISGVGHGSLTRNKELYIDSLIHFSQDLNQSLLNLEKVLKRFNLSFKDINGNKLTGYNYNNKIEVGFWKHKVYCRKGQVNLPEGSAWPIYLFGYYLSSPDVFFLDRIDGAVQYKNYSKNSIKYTNSRGQVSWVRDIDQVAWLNEEERADWLRHFENLNPNSKNYIRYCKVLVDAIVQLQKRGMHEEVLQCKTVFEKKQHLVKDEEELNLKMALVNYIRKASLGDRNKAKKNLDTIEALIVQLKDENKILKLKAAIEISLFEGEYGDINNALKICQRGIEEALEIKKTFPLSAEIDELELRKNMIYLYSRMNEGQDTEALKKQCIELFYLASRLYNSNLENRRIVDVLGFVCNLYGDFSGFLDDGVTVDETDRKRIEELNKFGLKIRKILYETFPDDVWATRGYAWSVHCKGRVEYRLKNNISAAKKFLYEAENIRSEGEKKYNGDLGIKEDLIENYIELIKILPANEEFEGLYNLCEKKLSLISRKEHDSPRVIMLKNKIQIARDFINQ